MPLATVVSLIGLAAVLLAVYRDRAVLADGPAVPTWDALPAPADLGNAAFPLAVPGYDPASVDLHLDRLRRAYTDLYEAAPEHVLAAARAIAATGAAPEDVPREAPEPDADPDADPAQPPQPPPPAAEAAWDAPARTGGQDRA